VPVELPPNLEDRPEYGEVWTITDTVTVEFSVTLLGSTRQTAPRGAPVHSSATT